MFGELELGSEQRRIRIDERRAITFEQLRRWQFAVPLCQFRLVVEEFEMTGRTGLEKKDDALGFGCEMRRLCHQPGGFRLGRRGISADQRLERNCAEPDAAFFK